MKTRYRFVDTKNGVVKPACYFTPSEHGFQIHFGKNVQPITAFSREALEAEVESLTIEGGYAVFTETEFRKGVKHGLIQEREVE